MTRFNSEATACTQFKSNRGENPILCFHGYDLFEMSSQNENNRSIVYEQLGWQAGEWIVSVRAGYDYGFSPLNVGNFSEAVYASSVEHKLFQKVVKTTVHDWYGPGAKVESMKFAGKSTIGVTAIKRGQIVQLLTKSSVTCEGLPR